MKWYPLLAVLLALVGIPQLSELTPDPDTTPAAGGDKDGWVPLFNGKDLDGWDTWLGKPAGVKESLGLNVDRKAVYSVVMKDGSQAIRISGEVGGALTSKKEYENYHLKLEFKWGEKKWPPREKAVRNSGVLYHSVGPWGAHTTNWMRSHEFQIQERDCGDYWDIAGTFVDVEAEPVNASPQSPIRYKKGGTKYTVPRTLQSPVGKSKTDGRIIKRQLSEKQGEWSSLELLTLGGTSVHVIYGATCMVLTNTRHKVDGKEVPLTKGKLQLQSEWAEIYFRDIAIRQISAIPEKYLQ